jgi:chromosome segregation ATPase
MHREGQLKEGALVAVTERIYSQDEAMRSAEKVARQSRSKLGDALRRERKWKEKIADLEKTLKSLEDRLRGAQKELSDKRVHVRNLEAMIHRGGLKGP